MKKIGLVLLAIILSLQIFAVVGVSQQNPLQLTAVEIKYTVEDLVNCYIDSLNETNDKKRMEVIEVVWHPDGIFAYPGTEVQGLSAISSDIVKVQKKYPKAIVRRVGDVDIIENKYIRFNWEFGVPGEEPLIKGFDFGHIVDGRLKLVVGYFDYVSEKAK